MKKMNKSLLTVVLVALMSFVCAFVSLGFVNSGVSASADGLARPVSATTAAADDFYVVSGARVRVTETQSGIAFGSIVTKGYHDKLVKDYGSVEYFATAQVAGGANWSAIRFPIQPSFAEGAADTEVFELRTYINFNSLDDNDEAYRKAAYARDFAIETYVKAGDTYFKAADAENGINRSMQAVANAASLNWTSEEVDGFAQEDIAKYFTVGERSDKVTAYTFADNTAFVKLPGVDGTKNANVEIYAGANSLGEFTYDAKMEAYVGALASVKDKVNFSAFVDGKVYSTVAAEATKLTAENITDIKAATVGYYVLAEDVDMAQTDWTPYTTSGYPLGSAQNRFDGTFDGMNHTIDNFKNEVGQPGGLFYYMHHATVKNVAFTNVVLSAGSAGVIGRDFRNGSVLENVYVHATSVASNAGALFSALEAGANSVIKDVTVVIDSGAATFLNYNFCTQSIILSNCHFVGAEGKEVVYKPSEGVTYGTEGVDYFRHSDKTGLVLQAQAGETSMTDFVANAFVANQEACLDDITYINQDNITSLQTANSGYYVLEEDIDMTGITWENYQTADNDATAFIGTFNGNGHTISNFTNSKGQYGGLFGRVRNATVKNVAFVNATLTVGTAGIIARSGSFVFENVYLHVKSGTATSGTAIAAYEGANASTKMKDVTIVVDSGCQSFVNSAFFVAPLTLENCNFVGSSTLSIVYRRASDTTAVLTGTENTDYFRYSDTGAFMAAIASDNSTATDLAKDAFIASQVKYINQDNVTDLQTATAGVYVLTEDIDMTGIEWAPTTTFAGALVGNGHAISNFSGANLFYGFAGSIRGVNFINANHTGIGFLSGSNVSKNVTIEDSLFDLVNTAGSRKALIGYQTGGVATLKNVDVIVPVNDHTYWGMITSHAISSLVLDNVDLFGGNGLVHSTEGNNASFAGTFTGTYKTHTMDELMSACVAGTVSQKYIDYVLESGLLNPISQENFADLQSVTSGYYYLTEDIDMAEFTEWNPVNGFAATLDGNGYTISNFSSPAANYKGLVGNTAAGAIFKNLTIHAVTNANRAMLTGKIEGETTVTNCKFIVDKLVGSNAGVIGNVVQGDLTVSDTYIVVIDATKGATKVGIVAGGEASSKNVTVSNVHAFSFSGYITDVFVGDNCDNATLTETTIGADGALAVNGEDYFFYASSNELGAAVDAGTIDANFEAWLTELGMIKAISASNISELLAGGKGYFYLTEDIDMSAAGAATGNFWGTFDGKNHVISNSNHPLFANTYVCTIKNVIVKGTATDNDGGFIQFVRYGTTVENVIIEIDSLSGGTTGCVAKTLAGDDMVIRNTLIIVNNSTDKADNGIIFGGRYNATHTATIENVYVVDKATGEGKVTKLCGLRADGTDSAKLSADPVIVADASGLTAATMPTALVDLISIYDESFFG